MPEQKNKKETEVKRLCPECETEVTLSIDSDTGDREGRCSNCRLDVGGVVNRKRYASALAKIEADEKKAKETGKKSEWW
jgi:hypothetical protein